MTAADDDHNSVGAAATAEAASEKEAEGVSASSSHSNLLALLDAASRVETLPVPPAPEGQDDKADEKIKDSETAANVQDASKALPKTNALTAEMVRELTAQKAAKLSSALDVATASANGSTRTSPIVTASSSSSSTPTTSSIQASPALSSSTGSKGKLLASKKSTQSKFPKPKRPKLPCMAQPRLAGSAPTSAGSSAGTNWTITNRNAVPPAPHADTDDDSKIKGGGGPKPLKLEPVVKDTFPTILYRVLMKGYDDEEDGDAEPSSASAAGENPSEQPSSTPTTTATTTKAKTEGYQDIIHWLPEGTHFVIVDADRFRTEVMPKEFGVSQKLTSFTRRLSRWGFQQVRVPGYAQHMAFCHPKFRRGDKEAVLTIKSVQAEQASKNVANAAQARRFEIGLQNAVGARAEAAAYAPAHIREYLLNQRVLADVDLALPGALTEALGLHNVDPIVAARIQAAAAREVEEETLRIQHLERQLQLQYAQNHAALAAETVNTPYDGYVGVGAGVGAGAPHTGLQSLAARNAASALTRRYSGTGMGLAALEHASASAPAPVAALGATATDYGQSLADMHYAQGAQGLSLNATAAGAPVAQVPTAALTGAAEPPSIFGAGSELYQQSSPLEREIMLQARYKHLLQIQASLQSKALASQQDRLNLEEQQYLAAQHAPHAALTGVGAGIGAAGQGQFLPQQAVDSATQHVLAGAEAVIRRDSLLTGAAPAPGAAGAGYHHPHL